MEDNIVKAIEMLNNTLVNSYKNEFLFGIISTLIGTVFGAVLAFLYSGRIQKKQSRYNFLIETRKTIIENHFIASSNFDDVLKLKKKSIVTLTKGNELRKNLLRNYHLSIAKIQILVHSFSKNDPLYTEIAKYTEILVQLSDTIGKEEFKDIDDLSQFVWNHGPKDEKGYHTQIDSVQDILIKQLLVILELIGRETSEYIK